MSDSRNHRRRRRSDDSISLSGFSSPSSFLSWATSKSNRSGCFVVFFPRSQSYVDGRKSRFDFRRRRCLSSERNGRSRYRRSYRRRDSSLSSEERRFGIQLCRRCRRRRRSISQSISPMSIRNRSPSPIPRRTGIHSSPSPVPRRSPSPIWRRSISPDWIRWRQSTPPMRREFPMPGRFGPSSSRSPRNEDPTRDTTSPACRRPTPPTNELTSPSRPVPLRLDSPYRRDYSPESGDNSPLISRRRSPAEREASPTYRPEDSPGNNQAEASQGYRPETPPRGPSPSIYISPSRSRSRSLSQTRSWSQSYF